MRDKNVPHVKKKKPSCTSSHKPENINLIQILCETEEFLWHFISCFNIWILKPTRLPDFSSKNYSIARSTHCELDYNFFFFKYFVFATYVGICKLSLSHYGKCSVASLRRVRGQYYKNWSYSQQPLRLASHKDRKWGNSKRVALSNILNYGYKHLIILFVKYECKNDKLWFYGEWWVTG